MRLCRSESHRGFRASADPEALLPALPAVLELDFRAGVRNACRAVLLQARVLARRRIACIAVGMSYGNG